MARNRTGSKSTAQAKTVATNPVNKAHPYWNWSPEDAQTIRQGKKALVDLESFILNWYGPKCLDYDKDCINCKTWKLFDDLKERITELFQ